FCFFFSSRRRHTRSKRDWSSDVCSSDLAVYFSSGNGEVGPEDREVYGDDLQDLAVGLVLERGVLEGTKAFERALASEGIEHRVDYAPTGLHNWSTFMRYFDEGWEHIKPALQG